VGKCQKKKRRRKSAYNGYRELDLDKLFGNMLIDKPRQP
jgi:hypothetical protein